MIIIIVADIIRQKHLEGRTVIALVHTLSSVLGSQRTINKY